MAETISSDISWFFFFLYIIGATGRFPYMKMLLLCTSISAYTSHPLVFCLLGSALSSLWKPVNQSGTHDRQHPPAWLHFCLVYIDPAWISSSSPPFFLSILLTPESRYCKNILFKPTSFYIILWSTDTSKRATFLYSVLSSTLLLCKSRVFCIHPILGHHRLLFLNV